MRHNTEPGEFAHTPVLWKEVLQYVRETPVPRRGDVLVDCTLGEGGHSKLLLENVSGISVVALERDPEILEIAAQRLRDFSGSIELINDNFANAASRLEKYRGRIQWFLYDFGISSFHFDRSGRGFSFRADEPLDMRLDKGTAIDARHIVNNYSEKELTDIFFRYGEERWAKRIAKYIGEYRKNRELSTSLELAELVLRAIPKRFHVRNIHPATRVFQALRIVVNDELSAIEASLRDAAGLLETGGRIMAISFHSLEDRIVKNTFRRLAKGCTCAEEGNRCLCEGDPVVKILTKKPITPQPDEIAVNNRARSAKMRVCEKL